MKNIKIVINEKNKKLVKATMFFEDTDESSNVGTLWMLHDELEFFKDSLMFGAPDECQLIVQDDTTYQED